MQNGLKVNTNDMYDNGNSTVRDAEEFNGKITDLKSHKESLMEIWRGPAATEFSAQVDNQVQNLNEFKELLNEFGEKIMSGAQRFDENEQESTVRAQNLFD